MDIIFNILKQLAASLSPTDFMLVIVLLIITSVLISKIFLKMASMTKKKNGIFSFFSGEDKDDPEFINKKIDELILQHHSSVEKIMMAMQGIRDEAKNHDEDLKEHLTNLVLFKSDLLQSSLNISRDLESLKQMSHRNDSTDQVAHENVKQLIQRSHDIMHRISSQLEKVDEFARAAIPEFRSYHKELSKEVSDLNRDIALVERSIQTQMNTTSVKLR